MSEPLTSPMLAALVPYVLASTERLNAMTMKRLELQANGNRIVIDERGTPPDDHFTLYVRDQSTREILWTGQDYGAMISAWQPEWVHITALDSLTDGPEDLPDDPVIPEHVRSVIGQVVGDFWHDLRPLMLAAGYDLPDVL